MASIDPPQICTVRVGDVRSPVCSFALILESGELLTGTPLVAEKTTSDLTLTNKAVNTAPLVVNGLAAAIGQAVQFSMSGQNVANSPYIILVTASTDATPAQTFKKRELTVLVEA